MRFFCEIYQVPSMPPPNDTLRVAVEVKTIGSYEKSEVVWERHPLFSDFDRYWTELGRRLRDYILDEEVQKAEAEIEKLRAEIADVHDPEDTKA